MVLGELLKVGDVVVINIPNENWEWGYHPVDKQNGIEAKVTGFDEIEYSRIQNYGREPGIYVNYAWVKLDVLGNDSISSCFLDLKDKAEYDLRYASWHHSEFDKSRKPIRPLPEMKFWEGDVVSVDWHGRDPSFGSVPYYVSAINYRYLGEKRQNGNPMPEYNVTPVGESGCHVSLNESDLTLVERGNMWKHYNGEKPIFKDLREEANFFENLGKVEEVKNLATGVYSWTLREAITAIRDGVADGMRVGHGMFGVGKLRHHLMRFEDRDLGERVRAATVEGFKDADLDQEDKS